MVHRNKSITLLILSLAIYLTLFSGCAALLGLGAEDLALGGIEADAFGAISIDNSELFSSLTEETRLGEGGSLYLESNNSHPIAELETDHEIRLLKDNATIDLQGNLLYEINDQTYVRNSPYSDPSNNNVIATLEKGHLVLVSDELNGWYEIQMGNHQIGFIPIESSIQARPKYRSQNVTSNDMNNNLGYRPGVNYIANNAFKNDSQTIDMIVNITTDDGGFDPDASNLISSMFNQKGYNCTASFFSKYYYIDGIYKELMGGNLEYIQKLKLYSYADFILIGKYTIQYRTNQIKNNMLTAEMNFNINKINLKNGKSEYYLSKLISGTGFSANEARDDVMQSFYTIIKTNCK